MDKDLSLKATAKNGKNKTDSFEKIRKNLRKNVENF